MVKFDEYVYFDYSSIHTEKIKRQVERYVNKEFDKSQPTEEVDIIRYPSFTELQSGLNEKKISYHEKKETIVENEQRENINRYKNMMQEAYSGAQQLNQRKRSSLSSNYAHLDQFKSQSAF